MDLADLKTFAAVVESGSVTKAAKQLNRVPSGVTTRILHLEEMLGVSLFLREKKRLHVTPKGRLLHDYARRIMTTVAEAERLMKREEPGGKFRIGAMESTAAARLPGSLAKLHALYPGLELELVTGTSRSLCEQLLDNSLDAIFAADIGPDSRIGRLPVFDEVLVMIAPKGHPPVKSPSDITCGTVLAFREGCSYRNRLLDWFRANAAKPERIVELASYHAIMGGAAAGMGIGIVPVSVLALFPDRNTLSIHPLPASLMKAPTELLWRKDMPSANLDALRQCLEMTGESLA